MNEIRRTLLELLVIAVVAIATGLAANAMHRNGLPLATNHFKMVSVKNPNTQTQPTTRNTDTGAGQDNINTSDSSPNGFSLPDNPSEADMINYIVNVLGYQAITHDEAVEIYLDPYHGEEVYIFIDARGGELHREGHIPRAYPFNHYNKKPYLETVRQACLIAEKIVVYCEGGKCEDSILTAGDLFGDGIDWARIFLYPGGMDLWTEKGMPIERGNRLSGDIVEGGAP